MYIFQTTVRSTFWFLINTDLQKVLVDPGSLPAHKRHSYPSPKRPQLHTTTTITWALLAVRLWLRWQVRPDTHGKNNRMSVVRKYQAFSASPSAFIQNVGPLIRLPSSSSTWSSVRGAQVVYTFSSLSPHCLVSHLSFIALLFSKVVAPASK